MALDEAGFRARYPEFKAVGSAMITTALADALNGLSVPVFGARLNEAHGCRTAHLLAGGRPWGAAARLKAGDGQTVYGAAFDMMVREHAAGYGVT